MNEIFFISNDVLLLIKNNSLIKWVDVYIFIPEMIHSLLKAIN
jgi:hypothetical protein